MSEEDKRWHWCPHEECIERLDTFPNLVPPLPHTCVADTGCDSGVCMCTRCSGTPTTARIQCQSRGAAALWTLWSPMTVRPLIRWLHSCSVQAARWGWTLSGTLHAKWHCCSSQDKGAVCFACCLSWTSNSARISCNYSRIRK